MCPPLLRLFCIIQLCIGFSLLLWTLGYPTLGYHYETKRKLLIIESALGDKTGIAWKLATDQEKEILHNNAEKATQSEKDTLLQLKNSIISNMEDRSSFSTTFSYLFQNPYFFLYIVCSILVPLMLLLNHSAKKSLLVFLPLIAACFTFDNLFFAPLPKLTKEEQLFPTEKQIQTAYGSNESYSLSYGLETFLIEKYLKQIPSSNPEMRLLQSENARYRLLVERALLQNGETHNFLMAERRSKSTLLIFILWNVFFTLVAYKKITDQNSFYYINPNV